MPASITEAAMFFTGPDAPEWNDIFDNAVHNAMLFRKLGVSFDQKRVQRAALKYVMNTADAKTTLNEFHSIVIDGNNARIKKMDLLYSEQEPVESYLQTTPMVPLAASGRVPLRAAGVETRSMARKKKEEDSEGEDETQSASSKDEATSSSSDKKTTVATKMTDSQVRELVKTNRKLLQRNEKNESRLRKLSNDWKSVMTYSENRLRQLPDFQKSATLQDVRFFETGFDSSSFKEMASLFIMFLLMFYKDWKDGLAYLGFSFLCFFQFRATEFASSMLTAEKNEIKQHDINARAIMEQKRPLFKRRFFSCLTTAFAMEAHYAKMLFGLNFLPMLRQHGLSLVLRPVLQIFGQFMYKAGMPFVSSLIEGVKIWSMGLSTFFTYIMNNLTKTHEYAINALQTLSAGLTLVRNKLLENPLRTVCNDLFIALLDAGISTVEFIAASLKVEGWFDVLKSFADKIGDFVSNAFTLTWSALKLLVWNDKLDSSEAMHTTDAIFDAYANFGIAFIKLWERFGGGIMIELSRAIPAFLDLTMRNNVGVDIHVILSTCLCAIIKFIPILSAQGSMSELNILRETMPLAIAAAGSFLMTACNEFTHPCCTGELCDKTWSLVNFGCVGMGCWTNIDREKNFHYMCSSCAEKVKIRRDRKYITQFHAVISNQTFQSIVCNVCESLQKITLPSSTIDRQKDLLETTFDTDISDMLYSSNPDILRPHRMFNVIKANELVPVSYMNLCINPTILFTIGDLLQRSEELVKKLKKKVFDVPVPYMMKAGILMQALANTEFNFDTQLMKREEVMQLNIDFTEWIMNFLDNPPEKYRLQFKSTAVPPKNLMITNVVDDVPDDDEDLLYPMLKTVDDDELFKLIFVVLDNNYLTIDEVRDVLRASKQQQPYLPSRTKNMLKVFGVGAAVGIMGLSLNTAFGSASLDTCLANHTLS